MSEFFEYDPVTGIRTDMDFDALTGDVTLRRTANVESVLDFAKERAAAIGRDVEGMREGWWVYAYLPAIVMLQMRAKGINVFDRTHQKRMFAEINEHYPHLKCVNALEGAKAVPKVFLGAKHE